MNCADCIPDGRSFPLALDPFQVTRYEIAEFGREAAAANIRYLEGTADPFGQLGAAAHASDRRSRPGTRLCECLGPLLSR
jgi:hypothetical protein